MPQQLKRYHAPLLSALVVIGATLTLGVVAGPAAATPASSAGTKTVSFSDNFTGPAGSPANPSKWVYQTGGNWGGGKELEAYTNRTANASLTGHGTLLITAQGQTYTGSDKLTRNYTSARLISKQSVLYGSVSARIKLSGATGAWPAFWALGANYAQVGWPACGELDVMEATGKMSNLYGSFHGPVVGGTASQAYNQGKMISPTGGLAGAWHVYTAQWSATSITFLLDGQAYVTVLKSALPANEVWEMNNAQNLLLNIAVGGMAGTPAAPAQFKSTMEVDWVRVTGTTSS